MPAGPLHARVRPSANDASGGDLVAGALQCVQGCRQVARLHEYVIGVVSRDGKDAQPRFRQRLQDREENAPTRFGERGPRTRIAW